MKKNALYIQSGGPTAVINASAYGVIEACREYQPDIHRLYASAHGIVGVMEGKLYDCFAEEEGQLELLKETPSMAFGSCRYEVREDTDIDYEKILDTLKRFQIYYIFINGGNGSAAAGLRLYQYLTGKNYEFRLMVIPKTVDNDIAGIDHAPGFPSAARHVVTSIAELVHDMHTYDTELIMVAEVMGRNTGFLAAASLAAGETGYGPDLIYVPEVVFDPEQFIQDVRNVLERKGKCFVVVPEGVRTADGKYLFENTTVNKGTDPSRNMGGITPYLNALLREHFICKIRCIDLGLMQRCAVHDASALDLEEAELLGRSAVEAAVKGASGQMVTLLRRQDVPYQTETDSIPLEQVAEKDRVLDLAYVTSEHNYIQKTYLKYILPLIGPLPEYASLKYVTAVPEKEED
ncbi:MAG: diphosphate--fructose-6-phosphate 1-phosphotransferase [Lachnospiraceae bacterium]|nr:diphosphate--fructose-6-phosphate 1-phosphotransferase [Lachnospiraceae bacterium]